MTIKNDDFSIPPHTLSILKQMCKEVRVSFKKVDFNEDGWYRKYEWTEYKQEKFKKWLVDYLYSNKEARPNDFPHSLNGQAGKKRVVPNLNPTDKRNDRERIYPDQAIKYDP